MPTLTPISKYPNYGITTIGKIWVYLRTDNSGRISGGRWLKPIIQKNNRCHITLYRGGMAIQQPIHKLVLETYVGPCPDGMECRHLNGNPQDNKLENLIWGTPKENAKDRELHGNTARGEKNGMVKLTQRQVIKIIQFLKKGIFRHSEIANVFRISKATISAIATRRNWGWLWEETA